MTAVRYTGNPEADIVVVCDVPTDREWAEGTPLTGKKARLFSTPLVACGYGREDFQFVFPCAPMSDDVRKSKKRESAHLMEAHAPLQDWLTRRKPKLLIYLGASAGRVVAGKVVAITKARGTPYLDAGLGCAVLPMLSPGHVLRVPEMLDIFNTDALMVDVLERSGWEVGEAQDSSTNYYWCTDLSHLVTARPKALSVDTETTGLSWYKPGVTGFVVQLGYGDGNVACVPISQRYWPALTMRRRSALIKQLRDLLEDPSIRKTGSNLRFDYHILRKQGIELQGWAHDTMNLAFVVDDNMREKSLDECARRWVPALRGYADAFNAAVDKSRMIEVPPDQLLPYAGGDADASYRLTQELDRLARADARNYRCYQKIIHPATVAFAKHVEANGIRVDTDALERFAEQVRQRASELQTQLVELIPPRVKRRHLEAGKELSLTRPDLVRDVLFSADGYALAPVAYTKTTAGLPEDPTGNYRWLPGGEGEYRQPSTSAKDHLPYFMGNPFVDAFIEYTKLDKLLTTYIGQPWDDARKGPTGLWQYIHQNEIHPSYSLSGTNTGRTSCLRADVLVDTRRGKVRADEVVPGDEVWTHKARWRPVTKLFRKPVTAMVDVTLSNGEVLTCTLDHRVLLITGKWLTVREVIARGCIDLLRGWVGGLGGGSFSDLEVTDIKHLPVYPVYDFEVAQDHSYLACGVFSHNSRDPNGQNFPKRGPLAKAYSRIFVPRPGYKFVACDLSQAELRIAAWMAGEQNMIRIYQEGGDIHAATAAYVMGLSIDQFNELAPEIRAAKRQQAKAINFGFLYGMGWRKFMSYAKTDYGVTFTEKEAQDVRKAFFRLYPKLATWHRTMREFVQEHGYVRALHGAIRRLPAIYSDDPALVSAAERNAINSPVQRFASDIGLTALIRLTRDMPEGLIRPVAFIHDALVCEVPEDRAEECASYVRWYMETPPLQEWFGITPPLPIKSDAAIGDNLGDMPDVDVPSIRPAWARDEIVDQAA